MAINELNRLSKSSKGVLATSDTTTNESFNRSQVNSQKNGASFVTSFEGSWAGDYKLALGKDAVNPGSSSFGLEGFGDIDFIPYSDRTNAVSYKGQAQVGSPIAFEVVGPTLKSSSFKGITWNVASVSPSANGLLTLHLNTSTVDDVYGLTGPAYDETGLWVLVIKGDTATRRENAVVLKVNTIINSTNMSVLEPTQSLYTAGDVVQVVFLRQAKSQMIRVPNTSSYLIMPPDRSLNSGLYPTASEWVSLGGDANFYGVGTAIAIPQPMNLVSGSVLTASLGNVLPTDLGTFDIIYNDTTTGIFADTSYYLNKVVRITKVKDASNDAVIEQGEDAVIGYFQIKEIDASVSSAVVLTLLGQPTMNHKTGVITYAGPYLSAGSANVEFTLHDTVDTLSSNYRADLVESARVKRLLSPSISSSGSIGGEVIPTSASSSLNECVFTDTSTYSHNLLDLGFKAVVYGGSSALGATVIDPQYYTVDYEGAIVYLNADAPIYDNYYISCVPVTEDAGQQGYGTRVTYEGKDVFCGNIDITSVKTGDGLTTVTSATAVGNTSLNFPNILASEVPETGVIEINTGATRYKLKYNSKSALGNDSVVIGDLTYLQDPVDFGTALSNGHVCFVRNLYSTREETLQAGANVRVNEMSIGSLSTEVLKLIDGSVQVPTGGFYAQELVGALPVGSTADIGRVHWDADSQTWQVTSAPRGGAPDAYEVNLELTRGSITSSKVLELTGEDVTVQTTLFKATQLSLQQSSEYQTPDAMTLTIDLSGDDVKETAIGATNDLVGFKADIAGVSIKTDTDDATLLANPLSGKKLIYSLDTTAGESWQPNWQVATFASSPTTITDLKTTLQSLISTDAVGLIDGETQVTLTGRDVSLFPPSFYIDSATATTLGANLGGLGAYAFPTCTVKMWADQGDGVTPLPITINNKKIAFTIYRWIEGAKVYLDTSKLAVPPTLHSSIELKYLGDIPYYELQGGTLLSDATLFTFPLCDHSVYFINIFDPNVSITDGDLTTWTLQLELSISGDTTGQFDMYTQAGGSLVLSNDTPGSRFYTHRLFVEKTTFDFDFHANAYAAPFVSGVCYDACDQHLISGTSYVLNIESADASQAGKWVTVNVEVPEIVIIRTYGDTGTTSVAIASQIASALQAAFLKGHAPSLIENAGFYPQDNDYAPISDSTIMSQHHFTNRMSFADVISSLSSLNTAFLLYEQAKTKDFCFKWVAPNDEFHPYFVNFDDSTFGLGGGDTDKNFVCLTTTGKGYGSPTNQDALANVILTLSNNMSIEESPVFGFGYEQSFASVGLFLSLQRKSCGYYNTTVGALPSASYSTASSILGLTHFRSMGPLIGSHKIHSNSTSLLRLSFNPEEGNTASTSIRRYSRTLTSISYDYSLTKSYQFPLAGSANANIPYVQDHYLDNPYVSFNGTDVLPEAKRGLASWSFDAITINSSSLVNFYSFWVKLTNDGENNTYGITVAHSLVAPEVIASSITLGDVVYLSLGSKRASGRVIQELDGKFRLMVRPLNTDKSSATGANALVPEAIAVLANDTVDFNFTATDHVSIISGGSTTLYNQGFIRSLATPLALGESTSVDFDGGVGLFGETPAAVLISGGRVGLLSGIDQPAGLNFAQPIVGTLADQDRAFETFVEHGIFTDTAYPSDSMGNNAGTVGTLSRGETASKAFHAPATSGVAGLRISGDAQVWVTNPRYLSSNSVKTAFFEYSDVIPKAGVYTIKDGTVDLTGKYPLDTNRTGTGSDVFPKTYGNIGQNGSLGGAHMPSGMGAIGPEDGLMVQTAIVNLGLTVADLKGLSLALGREIGEVDSTRIMFNGEDNSNSLGLALFTIGQSSMLMKTSLPFLRGTYLKLTATSSDVNTSAFWKIIDSPVLCPIDADPSEFRDVGSESSIHGYGLNSIVKTAQPLSAVVATLRVRVERFSYYPSLYSIDGNLNGHFKIDVTPASVADITKKYAWQILTHDASKGNASSGTFYPIVLMDVLSHGGHPSSAASDLQGIEVNPRALGKTYLPASLIGITSDWPSSPSTWDDSEGSVKLLGIHRLMNSKGQTPSVAFVSVRESASSPTLFSSSSMRAQARLVIHSSERGDRLDELTGLSTNGAFEESTTGRIIAVGHPKRLGLGIVLDGGLGVVSANALRVHGLKGPEDKLGALSVFGYPYGNPLDEELDGDAVVVSSRLNRTEFYGDAVIAGHNSRIVIEDSRSAFGLSARLFEANLAGSTPLNTQSLSVSYLDPYVGASPYTDSSLISRPIGYSFGYSNLNSFLPAPASSSDTIFPWTKSSMNIKGNGSITYERGFRPQDGTGSELLASMSKGVKSDKGIKGLEIPAIGECLLLPKGPSTLSGAKITVSPLLPTNYGRSSIRVGVTPTDLPIYEFYNGNTAFAMAGLHSINVGNVLQEHGYVVDDIDEFDYTKVREGQQFPFAYQYNNSDLLQQFNGSTISGLYRPAVLNAPETIPGILSHAYHHAKLTDHEDWNNFQVRLMDGMVIEDVTTGTFYTVGDIGRGRGWGTDTYQKPLSFINELSPTSPSPTQDPTGTLQLSFNLGATENTRITTLWNDFFDRHPIRPFSMGSVIGVNGNSNSAEIMYDLSPHFHYGDTDYNNGKLLVQNTTFTPTTGFGDRVDNGRVRRPTVGHKMRIVPNVEFVPVLGHRSVTGGLAVAYDKSTNYTSYLPEADAILYDYNYDFTSEDIGRTIYVCGTREYQLVGWYLVTDVVEDYVLDPHYHDYYQASPGTRTQIKTEFGVAVVRKIKRSGEFITQENGFTEPILPLRPVYPELHASLDYDTNGTRICVAIDAVPTNNSSKIVDMHTPDVFFPHYNASGSKPYFDPSPVLDINGEYVNPLDTLMSGLVISFTINVGTTYTFEFDRYALDANLALVLGTDRRLWNTKDLCNYLNANTLTSGVFMANLLKVGGVGWDDYDQGTHGGIIEWKPKYYWSDSATYTDSNEGISEYWDGGLGTLDNDYKLSNKSLPNFPIVSQDGTKPFICGLVCRLKKEVVELFNPSILVGRGCRFSVSLTFDPQTKNTSGMGADDERWRFLTASAVNSTAGLTSGTAENSQLYQITSSGSVFSYYFFHYNLRGFYSLKGHASEVCFTDRDLNSSFLTPVFNHPTTTVDFTITNGSVYLDTFTDAVTNNCYKHLSNETSFADSSAGGLRWVFSAPLMEENVGSYLHLTKQRPYRFNVLTHTQYHSLFDLSTFSAPYAWTSGWQRENDMVSTPTYTPHLDINTDIFRINRCLTTGDILVGGDCETYAVEDMFLLAQGSLTRRGTEISYSPLGVAGNWPDSVTQTLPGATTGSLDYPILYALQPIARERIVTVNPALASSNNIFGYSAGFGFGGLVINNSSDYLNVSKLWYPLGKEDATLYTGGAELSPTSVLGSYTSVYRWTPAGEWWQLACPSFTTSQVSKSSQTPPTLKIDLTESFTQAVGLGSGINTPYAGRAPRGARLNRLWVNFGLIGEGPESIIPGSVFTKDTFDSVSSSAITLPENQASMTFNLVVEIPGSIATNSSVLMTYDTISDPTPFPHLDSSAVFNNVRYGITQDKNDLFKTSQLDIFAFPSSQTGNGSFMGGRMPYGASNHSSNGSTLLYTDDTYSTKAPKYKGGVVVVPLYVNREAGDMMPNVMEKFVNHGALKAPLYKTYRDMLVSVDPTLVLPNFSTTADWDFGDGLRGLGAIPNASQAMFRPTCLFTDSIVANPGPNLYDFLVDFDKQRWVEHPLVPQTINDTILGWIDTYPEALQLNNQTGDPAITLSVVPLNINSHSPVVWGGQHFAYSSNWSTTGADLQKFYTPKDGIVLGSSIPRSSRLGGGILSSFSSNLYSQANVFDAELDYPIAIHAAAMTGITVSHSSRDLHNRQNLLASSQAFTMALTPVGDAFEAPQSFAYGSTILTNDEAVLGISSYYEDSNTDLKRHPDLYRYGRTLNTNTGTSPQDRRFKVGNWLDEILKAYGIPAQSGSMLPPGARVYLEVTTPWTLNESGNVTSASGSWISSVKCSFEVETADGTAWTLDVNKLGDD